MQDNIGPYRLLSLLRTGAHCQVWEVLRASDGERFALKTMMSENRKNKAYISGLKQEYEIGRNFDSPYVVKAIDFGVEDGLAYLGMELFAARKRKQLLQAHRQNDPELKDFPQTFPQIVERGAMALAYVHSQGWLHRDVKPHNFLSSPAGDAKLIDFSLSQKQKKGIGKLFAGTSKVIQGTRSYMAPEQIRGKALDPRADLYGFACTVFELFSGKPPYTGLSANDLLTKHLRAQIPNILTANKDVTPEFADLLRQSMAKSPDDRPESMDAFLEQFHRLQVYTTSQETAARKS